MQGASGGSVVSAQGPFLDLQRPAVQPQRLVVVALVDVDIRHAMQGVSGVRVVPAQVFFFFFLVICNARPSRLSASS